MYLNTLPWPSKDQCGVMMVAKGKGYILSAPLCLLERQDPREVISCLLTVFLVHVHCHVGELKSNQVVCDHHVIFVVVLSQGLSM